jgi:hypothetical protein
MTKAEAMADGKNLKEKKPNLSRNQLREAARKWADFIQLGSDRKILIDAFMLGYEVS